MASRTPSTPSPPPRMAYPPPPAPTQTHVVYDHLDVIVHPIAFHLTEGLAVAFWVSRLPRGGGQRVAAGSGGAGRRAGTRCLLAGRHPLLLFPAPDVHSLTHSLHLSQTSTTQKHQEYFFPREDEAKARAAAAFARSVAVPPAAAARHRRSATALPAAATGGPELAGSHQGSPVPVRAQDGWGACGHRPPLCRCPAWMIV